MIVLTDLEICKRIAEIEGRSCWQTSSGEGVCINCFEGERDSAVRYYNPLTDDALCFTLMLKYEVSLTYGGYAVTAEILIEKEDGEHSFATQAYCPKRAICLAIIASKVGL
tara:strand:- start:75 stop:407 length:333 start_codon:yes stop_codon:yes gene_type:complete